jgi:hypothetical protein
MTLGSWPTKPPHPTTQQSPPSGGGARSGGAAPSRAMGGSPPSVRVSSFSPTITNSGSPPLVSRPLARHPSPAHSPAADETKVADDATYSNSVEKAPLFIFDEGNILLNDDDAPTNGAPPLLLAQASISSINEGTNNDSAAPCSAISSDNLATVVVWVKAIESLLLARLTTLKGSFRNHAVPTNLATVDAWISELEPLLSAHATVSSHVWAVEQHVLFHDSSIVSIRSTIDPTQHLPPIAPMAPLGAPNGPPSGLGVDATSPHGAPPTTPSRASNNNNPPHSWSEIHAARAKLGTCPDRHATFAQMGMQGGHGVHGANQPHGLSHNDTYDYTHTRPPRDVLLIPPPALPNTLHSQLAKFGALRHQCPHWSRIGTVRASMAI